MPKPKKIDATRKPIPKALSSWTREYDGLIKFRDAIPDATLDNGSKWGETMKAYVIARIKALERHKPKARAKKGK